MLYSSMFRVFVFVFISSLAGGLGIAVAANVTLEQFAGNPPEGFSIDFSASLEPISALQFDVEFDSATAALFPSPGAATSASNKMLIIQDVDPNRKRLIVYGINGTNIVDGALADVTASPRSSGPLAVQISNVKAVNGNGISAPLDVRIGKLTMTLDSSLRLTRSGVWNAASLQTAPVSGGAIMTLRGEGIGPSAGMVPTSAPVAASLGGIWVTFDNLPAPLLYAGPDQINVVAPWGITNRAATQIKVTRNSTPVASVSAPVAATSPEIFTLSATGTGAGAVINEDGTVNTPLNAAPMGSVIAIYGTGLGPLTTEGLDGSIAGLSNAGSAVSVTIGGIPAPVEYAGSAPSLVSGVFQVNCRVPPGLTPGPAVEVRVTAGEVRSVSGVTIAVQ